MTGRRKAKGALKDRDNNRHRSSERKKKMCKNTKSFCVNLPLICDALVHTHRIIITHK